jgi:malate dehydrogenase (oxaloacetate-decarboxylating)(NADP+)
LNPEQSLFARETDSGLSLKDVIKKYKPTILVGVTAFGGKLTRTCFMSSNMCSCKRLESSSAFLIGLFTEDLIREMSANCERPIIFPLSNPTSKAECTAEQAYEWTNGSCIFASGSPFDAVEMDDGRILTPSQCNNMYVFPGLGLGLSLCAAKRVTDRMLYIAAEALANFVSKEDLAQGKVFPHIDRIREVSHSIAVAVIKEAIRVGLATKNLPLDDLDAYVARKMYFPEYVPLVEKREISI